MVFTSITVTRWLQTHTLISVHLSRLLEVETSAKDEVAEILMILRKEPFEEVLRDYDATTFEAHAAICLHVVKTVAAMSGMNSQQFNKGLCSLAGYVHREQIYKFEDAVEAIRDVALDGLFEYLDERLDSDSAIYAVLLKYKQRCEWFFNQRLRGYAESGLEGKTGERGLAIDLYDYILGQGVDFVVEQASASGEVDLVLTNSDGRKLVIDAKYISVDVTKSAVVRKLAAGLHQVARYCNDYSEPTGFLVTFIATSKRITLELDQRDGLDYVTIGGRCIYYLPILISDEPSASRSGVSQEIVIGRSELIAQVEDLDVDTEPKP
ncbi:hypothetical protein BK665_18460 [Pseudomonas frederiksbergensis]|uniref:Uncharacterized protein n=2 Tax=Pseudomonas frederiksbergensis TaxID=104087 RepID=A0A423KGA6_9PSED|nr:hypothetical protein BK665_18460 [Pseudomonas frederiksbergensis]